MNFAYRHGVLLGSVAALALAVGCSRKSAPGAAAAVLQRQPVEVATITRRDMAESLALVGSLAANESAQIRAEIAGPVRVVSFNEGELVEEDKVLIKVDDAELRAQLTQAEAAFHLTELNLKRSENLTEARSMSQAEADRASSEHASAQAAVALLRVRLDKTEIKAPFDGVVGARTVSPGDYVNATTVITTLDDLSRLKIDFQVPERFLAKVAPGTKFVVASRSTGTGPRSTTRTPGEVYFVSSSIDRATRSSQIKGYLDRAPAQLRPGMFANVELVLSVKEGALTVPEGAILTTPRGTQIVVVGGTAAEPVAEIVAVKLGLRVRGLVEIEAVNGKLGEQQQVVASGVGALALFPGAKLEPRPQKEQFRPAGAN